MGEVTEEVTPNGQYMDDDADFTLKDFADGFHRVSDVLRKALNVLGKQFGIENAGDDAVQYFKSTHERDKNDLLVMGNGWDYLNLSDEADSTCKSFEALESFLNVMLSYKDRNDLNPEQVETMKKFSEFSKAMKNLSTAMQEFALDLKEYAEYRSIEQTDSDTVETSDVRACNTDCLAYAKGTCQFIDATKLTQPADEYGLKDKRECPRYRQVYPERV